MDLQSKLFRYHEFIELCTNGGVTFFEYIPDEERIQFFDSDLNRTEEMDHFLDYLESSSFYNEDDRWKAVSFYKGEIKGPIELTSYEDGEIRKIKTDGHFCTDESGITSLIGFRHDVTKERSRERQLEEQAMRDPLTGFYNRISGEHLIRHYLRNKDPLESCGLIVVDIDYFKNVNDNFGHLFGDKVLKTFSGLAKNICAPSDILMRMGGDEFVILLKNIGHSALINKTMNILEAVRKAEFEEEDYCMTCSMGVCFLPQNTSGYTYEQLFENADWALYRAKENGRNQYAFCDNLRRFEMTEAEDMKVDKDIDVRYLHNDICSTAFEIFEKTNNFPSAINILMKVIGIRFNLDRISILRSDVKEGIAKRLFLWTSDETISDSETKIRFSSEDFRTMFRSYDEFGTAVLHYDDNMYAYSGTGQKLLMQGGAKTLLNAALYNEGQYSGAIAYVTCDSKRFWSRQNRKEFGELTKIIAAHLFRYLAVNGASRSGVEFSEYDRLTGLLSFTKFREEVEDLIVAGYGPGHVVIYTDFEDFKFYNQKFGFIEGDKLLRQFGNYVLTTLQSDTEVFFTRAHADQFIIFRPWEDKEGALETIKGMNEEFIRNELKRVPDMRLRLRTGIYFIEDDCLSAVTAIDAANEARKLSFSSKHESVFLYDDNLKNAIKNRNDVIHNMSDALKNGEFVVYLQPLVRLKDMKVTAAEALIRWKKPDGTILYPDAFVPLYEDNGKIVELDMYGLDRVCCFLAEMREKGARRIPISINASSVQAEENDIVRQYENTLKKYNIPPKCIEVEITESAMVDNFEGVQKMLRNLKNMGFGVAIDDFGAGYSIMNMLMNVAANIIKLDRVFIQQCENSKNGMTFLSQVISMMKKLGCTVLCEGIETEKQAIMMRDMGCDMAQGYWFDPPIPAEEFAEKYLLPEE